MVDFKLALSYKNISSHCVDLDYYGMFCSLNITLDLSG